MLQPLEPNWMISTHWTASSHKHIKETRPMCQTSMKQSDLSRREDFQPILTAWSQETRVHQEETKCKLSQINLLLPSQSSSVNSNQRLELDQSILARSGPRTLINLTTAEEETLINCSRSSQIEKKIKPKSRLQLCNHQREDLN